MVAIICIYTQIYMLHMCVCEYTVLGGAEGKGMVGGALKEFRVYAHQ